MKHDALTEGDLAFLKSLPASTEPPTGGTREQRSRIENLPWGLVRDGRRTDLGDFVVAQADALVAAERERDGACAAERARADAAEARLDALLAPVEGVDLEEALRLDREATPGPWWAGAYSVYPDSAEGSAAIVPLSAAAPAPRIADLRLIATYRTAAPAAVRAVARLAAVEQERDEAQAESAAFATYREAVTGALRIAPMSCAEDVLATLAAPAWRAAPDATQVTRKPRPKRQCHDCHRMADLVDGLGICAECFDAIPDMG